MFVSLNETNVCIMELLSNSEREKLKTKSLADKHGVSPAYVRMLFRGKRNANTPKAKEIIKDAKSILTIVSADV